LENPAFDCQSFDALKSFSEQMKICNSFHRFAFFCGYVVENPYTKNDCQNCLTNSGLFSVNCGLALIRAKAGLETRQPSFIGKSGFPLESIL